MKRKNNYLKKEQYPVYAEVKYDKVYNGLISLYDLSKAIILAYENDIKDNSTELEDLDSTRKNLSSLKKIKCDQDLIDFYENNEDWVIHGIELCSYISQYEHLYENINDVFSTIASALDAFEYLKIMENNIKAFNEFINLLNVKVIEVIPQDTNSLRTVIKAKVRDGNFNRLNSNRKFKTYLLKNVDESVSESMNLLNGNVCEFVIDDKPMHDDAPYSVNENLVCFGINNHKDDEPTDLGVFMYTQTTNQTISIDLI